VKVLSAEQYKVIGQTRDDAVGEAFDKTAKLLNLGYPGGPQIEKRALLSEDKYPFSFPRPMINSNDLDFSFSGLKTSVLYKVNDLKKENNLSEKVINDIAHEFQNAAVDCLIEKTLKACHVEKSKSLVLSGGVAANKYLRKKLEEKKGNIKLYYPDLKHCTDNGLMIAFAGYQKIKQGRKNYFIEVTPRWSLENV
jgi:N6-L-threonylcarbamoyladenine synthase